MTNMKELNEYQGKVGRVLISKEQIDAELVKAGAELDKLYDGKPLLILGLLKGSFIFMADLCRAISVPCEIGFMRAKSYGNGTVSSGVVEVTLSPDQDLTKYHVVLVEDIIDTGRTVKKVAEVLRAQNPLSLHIVTLLDKPDRRVVECKADISLFTIPDLFVIGYGLDCAELYRNLPYVAEYIQ